VVPPPPGKIVCVGRNYRAHAAELGSPVPREPLIFLKPPSALVGDGDPIVLPPDASRVDFEGEIAVVPARRIRHADEGAAWGAIGWVAALNDVTARDLQRKDDPWTRAKGFDSFCPLGPLVAVGDTDPDDLEVTTVVSGLERQRGAASEMIFPIPFLLAWISRVMTLEPGDVIATGTPEGVGPLHAGDEVTVTVSGVLGGDGGPAESRVGNPVRA